MSSSPDVFVPFNPDAIRVTEFAAGADAPEDASFKVSDTLWAALTTDPMLKGELDRLIESRIGAEIRARVTNGEEELRARIKAEATAAGLEEGRRLAALEMEALRSEVSGTCRSILDRSQARLDEHEGVWIRALVRLLNRFMVPNDAQIASRIQRWLRESLEGLSDRSEVRVYLSSSQFNRLSEHLGPVGRSWSWHEDPFLADGEVRCETDMGGAVFAPGEQWNRLEKIVEELLGETPIEIGELPKKD